MERRPAVRRTTRTTASAASARSSCCSTSRRCTACRPTRWSRRATCREMWRTLPLTAAAARRRRLAVSGGPPVTPRYYGRPVIKEPVWKPGDPLLFFTGGLAGRVLGAQPGGARWGNEPLAQREPLLGAAAELVSPALLVSDLGRPERFLHMLRVFKVTSPMSVGSWILASSGGATTTAAVLSATGSACRGSSAPPRSSPALAGPPSRSTRRRCRRTPRCRCGTRPGVSCRSCSRLARAASAGGGGRAPAPRPSAGRRGGWRSAASWSRRPSGRRWSGARVPRRAVHAGRGRQVQVEL